MRNYKNQHFNHHRAVLEHFLKVGEARLHIAFGNIALVQAPQTTFGNEAG
jgi:hypothetical protein